MFYKQAECIPYQILQKLEPELEAIERWLNSITGEIIEVFVTLEERTKRQLDELQN